MTREGLVGEAARNNAEWCDAFCRAHGIDGRFEPEWWGSAVRTPPFYPDAVTLAPGVDAPRLLAGIGAGPDASVKDSFADLDLAAAGFRELFRSEWVVLEPHDEEPGWVRVRTAEELVRWEAQWGEAPAPAPFFRPALLGDPRIAFLAKHEGARIVAGAVANRSGEVIGLGNVFGSGAAVGAGAAARSIWGRLPVVGYGIDADGARAIGDLVVWAQ